MSGLFFEILNAFGLAPERCRIKPIGSGHIHDTYLVDQCGEGHPPLILQRINTYVFPDVVVLMSNMERVTAHVAFKNRKEGRDPATSGLVLVEATEGKSWVGNEEIGYWRMFWFIENQHSYERAEGNDMAFEGGRAIARFQHLLSDMDPSLVSEVIPHFHDLRFRLENFMISREKASKERSGAARALIEMVEQYSDEALHILSESEKLGLPGRLVHNDTKFNNILFNSEKKATCLIDLDTVMPGYSWFDVGDALRTCATSSSEDEEDVRKIDFNLETFKAFAHGFISGGSAFLTADEISLLPGAPVYFSYMQGVRFLTDYLEGDVYYKTAFPGHNLQRARAQLTLTGKMLEKKSQMHDFIMSLK